MNEETNQSFEGQGSSGDAGWADDLFDQLQRGHDGQCPYPCPFCMGMGLLKQMRPEVAEHLVTAGRELMLAARAVLDSVAEQRDASEGIEKIPLD